MNDLDLSGAAWRKSSHSNAEYNCVEVAFVADGRVAVRDSKQQGKGPILIFTPGEWDAFLGGAANGEFTRP